MPPERRCQETNASGEPCGAPSNLVDPESGLCPLHDPEKQEQVKEAARKGGEATARKMSADGLDESDLPPLDSPQAAEEWLDVVGRAVATGKLSHNAGKAVARLVREWLRARDAGEVEERVQDLEEKLAAAKRGDLEVLK